MTRKIVLLAFCLAMYQPVAAAASSNNIANVGADAVVEEGMTIENAAVVLGDLTVNGTVSENAAVIGGDLKIGPNGRILGNSAVIFGKIIKSPGAEISKKTVEIPLGWEKSCAFPILTIMAMGVLGLTILAGFAIIILLITLFFTERVGRNSFYIETSPWKSLFYGLVSSVLILPAILLLVVSIIGIPLIPLFIIAVLAASFFGYATMSQLIGLKFFRAIKKEGQHMLWEVVVGLVIICIVVTIPFIGWFIKTLIWMTGLGATMATRFGSKQIAP